MRNDERQSPEQVDRAVEGAPVSSTLKENVERNDREARETRDVTEGMREVDDRMERRTGTSTDEEEGT